MALNDIKVPKENASGTFDEVTLTPAQIGAVATSAVGTAATKNAPVTGNASSSEVVLGSDTRLSDARTPSSTLAHKASHSTGGTDALAPSDIGAQSIFVTEDLGTITANVTLTAARAKIYTVNTTTSGLRILLPTTGVMAGDVVTIRFTSVTGQSLTPVSGSMSGFFTNDILTGQQVTFIAASTSSTSWTETLVDRHPATSSLVFSSDDTYAYRASGRTLEGNITSAGRALLDDADAAAQRTTLGAAASGSITTSGLTQATARILGRTSSGVGSPEELSAADVRSFLNVQDGAEQNVQADWTQSNNAADDFIKNKPTLAASATTDTTNASNISSGTLAPARMGSGTPSASNFLRGDGSWQTVAAGVSGSTSTDNAIVRADSTANTVQESALLLDDATTSPQNNVAIRNNHSQTHSSLVFSPKGDGAFIVGPKPDGTTTGGNARGVSAQDLQIVRNAATKVASGNYSVCAGVHCTASSTGSVAIGWENASTAQGAGCLGGQANTASGQYSGVFAGRNSAASSYAATAFGSQALANRNGLIAIGGGRFSGSGVQLGEAQRIMFVFRGKTTNATATELFCNLDSDSGDVRLTVRSGYVMSGIINCTGVKSDGSAVAHYVREFSIKNVGGTTTLIGTVNTIGTDNEDNASADISVTANDTNDAINISVTGIASETWRWVASVDAVEVAYGT